MKYIELSEYVCTGLLLKWNQNTYKIICTTKKPGQHLPHSFVQTPDYIFISQRSELMLISKFKVFIMKNTLHFYSAAHPVISKCSKTLIKPQKSLEDNEAKYISLVMNVSFISRSDVDRSTSANILDNFFPAFHS